MSCKDDSDDDDDEEEEEGATELISRLGHDNLKTHVFEVDVLELIVHSPISTFVFDFLIDVITQDPPPPPPAIVVVAEADIVKEADD
jgi:hypothetical protein